MGKTGQATTSREDEGRPLAEEGRQSLGARKGKKMNFPLDCPVRGTALLAP